MSKVLAQSSWLDCKTGWPIIKIDAVCSSQMMHNSRIIIGLGHLSQPNFEFVISSGFHPPVRILMGRGPFDVLPRVLAASACPTIGHLDPVFVDLMNN